MSVQIARCPVHGLHGARDRCFVCEGPVEQVPFISPEPLRRLLVALGARRGGSLDGRAGTLRWDLADYDELLEAVRVAELVLSDAPEHTPKRVDPLRLRDGWMHVGCPTCGAVREWPVSRWEAEDLPLCSHSGGGAQLVWGRFTASLDPSWTRVVPVVVVEAQAAMVEPYAITAEQQAAMDAPSIDPPSDPGADDDDMIIRG